MGGGASDAGRDCCLSSAGSTKVSETEKAGYQGQSNRILDESASPVPSQSDVVRQTAPPLFSSPQPKCFQASARCNPTPHPKPPPPIPGLLSCLPQ